MILRACRTGSTFHVRQEAIEQRQTERRHGARYACQSKCINVLRPVCTKSKYSPQIEQLVI